MLDRADIPLRDLLWILVPGAFCAVYFWLTGVLLETIGLRRLSEAPLAIICFAGTIGSAIGYLSRCYARVPPWRTYWHTVVDGIRKELVAITEQSHYAAEKSSGPTYKAWIETRCEPATKGYIHYLTGLFFGLSSLYTLTLVFLLVPLTVLIVLLVDPLFRVHLSLESPALSTATAWLLAGCLLAYLCTSFGRRLSQTLLTNNLVLMRLPESKHQLRQLAAAADETAQGVLKPKVLSVIVQNAIALYAPLEAEQLSSVSHPHVVDQLDLRTNKVVRTVHIEARFSTLNAAVKANGRKNLYNGPIQARISTHLREVLEPRLGAARVRLQLKGPDPIRAAASRPSPQKRCVERLPLKDALRFGIVPDKGSVITTCERLGIDTVLLIGGKIVGPSPGLCSVVETILERLPPRATIYDPFAGTRAIEKLCEIVPQDLRTVSYDIADGPTYNAFKKLPSEYFDVVLLDPLYEHLPDYLCHCLPKLQYKYCVVQTGDISDIAWNKDMYDTLASLGTRLLDISPTDQYGVSVVAYERTQR